MTNRDRLVADLADRYLEPGDMVAEWVLIVRVVEADTDEDAIIVQTSDHLSPHQEVGLIELARIKVHRDLP